MGIAILHPKMERFAAEMVAAGEIRNRAEAMAAGIELLRERRTARADFLQTLEKAEAAAATASALRSKEPWRMSGAPSPACP